MPDVADSRLLLIDLETRQDDLLRRLDELNDRIERTLVESRLEVHCPEPRESPSR